MGKLAFAMNGGKLKYPNLRDELKIFLLELSDVDYQRQNWGKTTQNSCLDFSIHFLFDDTSLSEDANLCIGLFLYNKNEAKAVTNVIHVIDNIFNTYGTNLDDLEYVDKPEWNSVLLLAGKALKQLM